MRMRVQRRWPRWSPAVMAWTCANEAATFLPIQKKGKDARSFSLSSPPPPLPVPPLHARRCRQSALPSHRPCESPAAAANRRLYLDRNTFYSKISCLKCRAAKVTPKVEPVLVGKVAHLAIHPQRKCDSIDTSTRCARCTAQDLDCEYLDHHRGRRPNKGPAEVSTASTVEESQQQADTASTSATSSPHYSLTRSRRRSPPNPPQSNSHHHSSLQTPLRSPGTTSGIRFSHVVPIDGDSWREWGECNLVAYWVLSIAINLQHTSSRMLASGVDCLSIDITRLTMVESMQWLSDSWRHTAQIQCKPAS
jgi:hypothetical protein